MNSAQASKLKKMGILNLSQAKELGLGHWDMSRLVKAEKLLKVARGFYLHPHSKISSETIGFQIACAKFGPKSAIAGLSALFHYRLIEQVPTKTWVLVASQTKSRERSYRLLRSSSNQNLGVIQKNGFRIVTIERAIVEGLKYSSKIGERTALAAARTALARNETNEMKLGQMARALGYRASFQKHFEAITL